jgi:hypothetical protein
MCALQIKHCFYDATLTLALFSPLLSVSKRGNYWSAAFLHSEKQAQKTDVSIGVAQCSSSYWNPAF